MMAIENDDNNDNDNADDDDDDDSDDNDDDEDDDLLFPGRHLTRLRAVRWSKSLVGIHLGRIIFVFAHSLGRKKTFYITKIKISYFLPTWEKESFTNTETQRLMNHITYWSLIINNKIAKYSI